MTKETTPSADDDIQALDFEAAMAELEAIVRKLEEGKGRLDEAIALYDRGARLRGHCETKLKEAQARIDLIAVKADGGLATRPLDA